MSSVAFDSKAEVATGARAEVGTGLRSPSFRILKVTIWVYLLFWIFEGAVRKWIYPPSGNYLALGKDVILSVAYIAAFRAKVFPKNGIVWTATLLGIAAAFLGYFQLSVPYTILVYGFLAYIFPFPFIFLIARVFQRQDVDRVLHFLLWLSVPMVLLMLLQFNSPPGSYLNALVGQNEYTSTTEVVEGGRVRPTGTWSYVTPTSLYFMTLFSLLVGMSLERLSKRPYLVLFACATILATIISKSRTQLYGLVFTLIQYVMFLGKHMLRRLHYVLLLTAVVALALWFFLNSSLGRSGVAEFNDRLRGDISSGGYNIYSRLLYNYVPDTKSLSRSGLVGYGMGIGTTAAGLVLTGRRIMLCHESEATRIFEEFGWIGGSVLAITRVSVVALCLGAALLEIRKRRYVAVALFIPWWLQFLFATWGTPSLNMYNVFFAGLILALGKRDAW